MCVHYRSGSEDSWEKQPKVHSPGEPCEIWRNSAVYSQTLNPRTQIPLLPLPVYLAGSSLAQSGLSSPLSSEPSVKSS